MSSSSRDPWQAFDPEVQSFLRSVIDAEWSKRGQPIVDAVADRQFADEEARMRERFPDYDKHRSKILEFAIDNGIDNIEHAFSAYRGAQGAAVGAAASAGANGRTDQRRGAPAEKQLGTPLDQVHPDFQPQIKRSNDQLQKAQAMEDKEAELIAEMRAKNGSHAGAREGLINDINQSRNTRNRERTERAARGYLDERPVAKTREESRAEMDLQALDLIHSANAENVTQQITHEAAGYDR